MALLMKFELKGGFVGVEEILRQRKQDELCHEASKVLGHIWSRVKKAL